MTGADETRTGSCRCGAVEITVAQAPFMTAACHCTGCQKMTSSAFSLTAMFMAQALSVTKGETVRGGLRQPPLDHRFCPECMTWMFTRIDGQPFVNVRPTMFDEPAWSRPYMETMTAEKLDWAQTGAQRSFSGFPGPDDFPDLMAAFAERG
ncbi:aldehyde-activating protein [Oceanicola sp. 22II-s10i]|uniref:GFA family protein n=1 Tax=Oceanicola sp. 22II-s10i TaxID=1317116 RepID=UPI000B528508|nr:GFA family protein [Oceanicola sp. 22II-s10i]OWU85119.1 aldehyde-activating protein [Oceanicola sp. 22II-s10i]